MTQTHNLHIFGEIPFVKLKTNKKQNKKQQQHTTVKGLKTMLPRKCADCVGVLINSVLWDLSRLVTFDVLGPFTSWDLSGTRP